MDKKIEELAAFLKSGSKIHIKKSQRGSFTRYCNGKVTSECIRRGKNSPDPKIRKKATFAANARKWKHAEGGTIEKYASGNSLVYKPFTEQSDDTGLKYNPFIPNNDIIGDWTPSFPVEPVRNYTPIEQAPEQPKKETEQEVKTPEFELEQIIAPRDATYVAKPNVSKYNKTDQSKFTKDLHSAYVSELTKRGIDPQYADWLTAQDALETRWGASAIGNYNFGNIQYNSKVHGSKYSFREATDHHKDGSAYSAKFLNFNSLDDYVRYKVAMLSNQNSNRYRDIFKGDVNGFADRIQKSGYAESTNYAKALKDVISSVKRQLT